MSLEAFGDEGDVPRHGRETALYQELSALHAKLEKLVESRKAELEPEEIANVRLAVEFIKDTLELLDHKI